MLIHVYDPIDGGVNLSRGDVNAATVTYDIEFHLPGLVSGEGSYGVGEGVEAGAGDEVGEDVELDELEFLAVGERVEEARWELREGAVFGCENG